MGLDSHNPCYKNPIPKRPEVTACRLANNPSDIFELVWIAKGQWYQSAVLKQACDIAAGCAGRWIGGNVKQDYQNYVEKLATDLVGISIQCYRIRAVDWFADKVVDGFDTIADYIKG
ncbi:unnamed protein product [Adineta steineri]|uniref:Uncharacterized protein n=1 Tax=Adineta steineri TaxID=433720 RepID=A0A813WJS3_9BILA|nr:unnamed protein product [Adineta steineri]CAF0867609.1 unnamed protein product [Adineta steineri]CAF0867649.1 unnamed protein product [Adineta steineri]CAF3931787.1 unnamed protein product [Adineta steineri]CAF4164244.1 unnamed protein product [Adineta steineri]